MSIKRKIQLIIAVVWLNILVIAFANEAVGQERIDTWYGKEMTLLHAELKYDQDMRGDKFKYRSHGNDKVSLTMTDYRGVKCQYVSLNGGLTIDYRVDHYSRKEYANRKTSIKSKWESRSGYYVLQNTVVAIFDDKSNSIGFGLLTDFKGDMTGQMTTVSIFSK